MLRYIIPTPNPYVRSTPFQRTLKPRVTSFDCLPAYSAIHTSDSSISYITCVTASRITVYQLAFLVENVSTSHRHMNQYGVPTKYRCVIYYLMLSGFSLWFARQTQGLFGSGFSRIGKGNGNFDSLNDVWFVFLLISLSLYSFQSSPKLL